MNNIGEKLREFRKASGLSQMKLADKVGVSYQQIQKYEKGTSKLSVPRLIQLADVFGVPITAFLDEDHKAGSSVAAANFSADEVNLIIHYRNIASRPIRMAISALMAGINKALKGKV